MSEPCIECGNRSDIHGHRSDCRQGPLQDQIDALLTEIERLRRDKQRLLTAMSGISSCSTCDTCRDVSIKLCNEIK